MNQLFLHQIEFAIHDLPVSMAQREDKLLCLDFASLTEMKLKNKSVNVRSVLKRLGRIEQAMQDGDQLLIANDYDEYHLNVTCPAYQKHTNAQRPYLEHLEK